MDEFHSPTLYFNCTEHVECKVCHERGFKYYILNIEPLLKMALSFRGNYLWLHCEFSFKCTFAYTAAKAQDIF